MVMAFPVLDSRLDGIDHDRSAENRAADDGADRAVRAFPHLCKLWIFLHPLTVRRDGSALHGNAKPLCGFSGRHRDLILCRVAVEKAEVIILCLEIYERKNQLILDHPPEDSGHLVAVHLDKRGFHGNFSHYSVPPNKILIETVDRKAPGRQPDTPSAENSVFISRFIKLPYSWPRSSSSGSPPE